MKENIKSDDRRSRSGGKAGSSGFNFQAHAIAVVYTAMLNDAPFAAGLIPSHWTPWHAREVLMETGKGGDDFRIILCSGIAVEIQAKRSAVSGAKLFNAIKSIGIYLIAHPDCLGALICGDGSSQTIKNNLREDLQRVGLGRTDDLSQVTTELI